MLPNGWKKVKLGDVIKSLDAGVSVNSVDEPASKNSIGVLKTSCVSSGSFNPKENKAVVSADIDRVSVSVKADRIILSRMNSPSLVGANAYIASDFSNLYLPDRLWQLEPYPNKVNMRWLSYVLGRQETKNRFLNMATGTSNSMKNITKEDVLNLNISLPPIEEQKKIAATLSVWDSAIEKMEKLIEAKESQKNSLVWEIIENQNNHIKIGKVLFDKSKWKVCKLSDVTSGFDYGMNAAAKEYDGKNKYIRITDIDEISHKYNNDELVSPEGELDEKYLVKKGDILFARTGASTGKSYLYDDRDGVLYFAGFLIRAHITNDNPFFVYIQTLTAKYQNWVKKMSARSGQPGINAEEYKELPIVIPPIHEQNVIVDLFSKVEMEISLLKQQLENYKKQKQGLMQKLLTGEWRVK